MFDPKKYFKKTGYVYGTITRWKEDGTKVKCGVVFFNSLEEAKRWLHYKEHDYDPNGYGKSLVSKSQAYGFMHFM